MRRHGLRLYSADTATWAHRDRALASGNEAARRWESLTPHARTTQPPDDLLAMSLHRERGAMVADDVRALPSAPMVVAEGSVITPASVPDRARAVWILPSSALLERQLAARGGGSNPLYRLLSQEIEDDARSANAPTVAIDGIAETVAAVEMLFADALARGQHAETRAERKSLLREANLARVGQVQAFCARPWASGEADDVERSFICECGERECEADVRLTVADVRAEPAIAAGHGG
jgi:hypothetical protein